MNSRLANVTTISIPLRYNLESRSAESSAPRVSISIPLRYNLELIDAGNQVKYHCNFNSTKVQFGAVKLDRKYHINKGFEKRFR